MWANGIIPSGFIALKSNSFIDERNHDMLREEKYYTAHGKYISWGIFSRKIFFNDSEPWYVKYILFFCTHHFILLFQILRHQIKPSRPENDVSFGLFVSLRLSILRSSCPDCIAHVSLAFKFPGYWEMTKTLGTYFMKGCCICVSMCVCLYNTCHTCVCAHVCRCAKARGWLGISQSLSLLLFEAGPLTMYGSHYLG